MKKTSYTELLKDPRWQKKRLEVMQSRNFACEECGDESSTLHVHHGCYIKGRKPWEYEDEFYHLLCESCHETCQRNLGIVQKLLGQLSPHKYELVIHILAAENSINESLMVEVASDAFANFLGIDERMVVPAIQTARMASLYKMNRTGHGTTRAGNDEIEEH
jgi:hypothetical protein